MAQDPSTSGLPPDPPEHPRVLSGAPPLDTASGPAPQGVRAPVSRSTEETVMFVLSYLGLLALVPYFVSKDPEVRWHAKQGLTLAVAFIVLNVAAALPLIGWVFGLLWPLVTLGGLVLIVLCISKALNGERWRIPLIADLADKW